VSNLFPFINWTASGGEVSHLESWLRIRFPPRSSGKITFAFDSGFARL